MSNTAQSIPFNTMTSRQKAQDWIQADGPVAFAHILGNKRLIRLVQSWSQDHRIFKKALEELQDGSGDVDALCDFIMNDMHPRHYPRFEMAMISILTTHFEREERA